MTSRKASLTDSEIDASDFFNSSRTFLINKASAAIALNK